MATLLSSLTLSALTGCAALETKSEPVPTPSRTSAPVAQTQASKPLPVMPPLQGARAAPVKKTNLTVPKKKVTTAGDENANATAAVETPECHTARDGRRYALEGKVRLYAPCQ